MNNKEQYTDVTGRSRLNSIDNFEQMLGLPNDWMQAAYPCTTYLTQLLPTQNLYESVEDQCSLYDHEGTLDL